MENKLFLGASVKTLEGGEFEVVASTGQTDRMGDIISPDGWYLTNYKKNPVMLWAHDNYSPAVSKAMKIWVENRELKAKGVFAPTPFAQELRTLVENGFLNAVSVGFMPLIEDEKGNIEIDEKSYRRANEKELKSIKEGTYKDDGFVFEKQELLEISWVNVPALPQALVTARKMGLDLVAKALDGKVKKIEKSPACRIEGETEEECRKRKIPELVDEGMEQDQAVAVAIDMCKEECEKKEETFDCECLDCGHKMTTEKHCSDIKCSKCGGEMRRIERPGPGKDLTSKGEVEMKEGRVISEKNKKLINNCINQMGEAISALKELLKSAEPEKDATPQKAKGRTSLKQKGSGNAELMLLKKTNVALDNLLHSKKNKGEKKDVALLRIADKVVEAMLKKNKAKK